MNNKTSEPLITIEDVKRLVINSGEALSDSLLCPSCGKVSKGPFFNLGDKFNWAEGCKDYFDEIPIHRMYMLKGYLNLLDTAPPCGRTIHDIAQKRTLLMMSIQMGLDLKSEVEIEIKDLIREIYGY